MNLFELFVKIGVDDQASKNIANITEKLGNGLKTAAKIGTAAVGVAATGITALTTAAVKNYAEYEQLVGGAELMFGKAFDTVMKNSQNAYKTVQLSQNEYLKQVNGFATGLKTSLGGNEQAAADLSHRIVQAEADIIAATGNTAENVQNAFNGIMKSNFTMLDNLQIGITPTKEGFQEVIDKVNEWNTANGNATKYQMGNLADMQSALVDYIDMVGMSGYAQREASHTIEGSLASMKGAWSNLITGIADDNADFDTLINNMVETVGTFAENIIPRVEIALGGIAGLIEKLAPIIVEKLPSLVSTILPKLLSAATSVVESVASVFPDLVDTVAEILTSDDTVKSFLGIITSIINAILDAAPDIVDAILEVLPIVIEELGNSIGNILPKLIDAVVKIIQSLAKNIGTIIQSLVEAIPTIIESLNKALKDNFPALLQGIITLVLEIVRNLPSIIQMLVDQIEPIVSTIVSVIVGNLPAFIAGIVQIVFEIVKALPSILASIGEAVLNIFKGIGTGLASTAPSFLEGLGSVWQSLTDWLSKKWTALSDWVKEKFDSVKTWGKDLIDNFIDGIKEKWESLKTTVSNVAQSIKDFLGFSEPKKGPLSNFHTYAPDMIDLFIKGVKDNEKKLTDQIASTFDFSDDIGDYDMEMAVGTSVEPYEGESFEDSLTSALRALVSVEENRAIDVNVSIDAEDSEMGRMLLNLLNVTATEVYA